MVDSLVYTFNHPVTPGAGAFTIARGARTHVDVVVAEVAENELIGRGEGTAIYYHGETAEGVAAAGVSQANGGPHFGLREIGKGKRHQNYFAD